MIRKLITLLVLVGLVYMGYRIVDPIGAQALLVRVQSWFADDAEPVLVQEDPVHITVATGAVSDTGAIDTDTEQVVVIPMSTGIQISTSSVVAEQSAVVQFTPTQSTPKPQSQSALSDQDMKDLQRLLNAIVE